LLLDTRASAAASQFPVAAIVNQIRESHASASGHPVRPLLIANTKGHGDHAAGDFQFVGLSDVTVVPPSRVV